MKFGLARVKFKAIISGLNFIFKSYVSQGSYIERGINHGELFRNFPDLLTVAVPGLDRTSPLALYLLYITRAFLYP